MKAEVPAPPRRSRRARTRVPLEQLAHGGLRAGYQPRGRVDRVRGQQAESCLALQPGDLRPDGAIQWEWLEEVQFTGRKAAYQVNSLDLVIPTRTLSVPITIALAPPRNAIAVGALAILTPDPTRVDPLYLVWYLNHPKTRARLAGSGVLRKGTLSFLSMAGLRLFEIDVPPLQRQRLIADIENLRRKEHDLIQARAAALDQLLWRSAERE